MHQAVEIFVAIHCTVIGLSHVLQPMAWVEFFAWLKKRGHAGVLVNGMLSLGFGSMIIAFHNVWTGLPTVVTLLGWIHIVKASLVLCFPQVGLHSLSMVSPEKRSRLVVAGCFLLVIGLFCWYLAFSISST